MGEDYLPAQENKPNSITSPKTVGSTDLNKTWSERNVSLGIKQAFGVDEFTEVRKERLRRRAIQGNFIIFSGLLYAPKYGEYEYDDKNLKQTVLFVDFRIF